MIMLSINLPVIFASVLSVVLMAAIITALASMTVFLFIFMRRNARSIGILEAIIAAYNDPVLFYDKEGRLAYINEQAENAFEPVRSDIGLFKFIEESARPDGPEHYLSDRFGNGYRLEIMRKKYQPGQEGRVVIIKGYARSQPYR